MESLTKSHNPASHHRSISPHPPTIPPSCDRRLPLHRCGGKQTTRHSHCPPHLGTLDPSWKVSSFPRLLHLPEVAIAPVALSAAREATGQPAPCWPIASPDCSVRRHLAVRNPTLPSWQVTTIPGGGGRGRNRRGVSHHSMAGRCAEACHVSDLFLITIYMAAASRPETLAR